MLQYHIMNDSIIYLLILAHGLHEYNNKPYTSNLDEPVIYAKTTRPTLIKTRLFQIPNVIIPSGIEYIQKITYTPFGLYNIMSFNDKKNIYNNTLDLVKTKIIVGKPLTELVKNEITFETIETKLAKSENPEYIVEDLRLLMKNRDSICQEYIYDKSINKNVPFKNKSFSSSNTEEDDDDENEYTKNGIYVMRQEGGPLKVGDNILQDDINTQQLLEKLSSYGYKNVIILDYSCDVCSTSLGMKPDDIHVDKLKQQILEGKIGRGGKTKRKTQKVKKYTKK